MIIIIVIICKIKYISKLRYKLSKYIYKIIVTTAKLTRAS